MPQDNGNTSNIIKKQANPVYASVLLNPHEEQPEDRLSWGKKFLRLPRYLRYGMIKEETEEKIIQTANRFGLKNPQDLGKLSRLIRGVFCGEVESSRVGMEIEKKMGLKNARKNDLEKELKEVLAFIKKGGEQAVREDLEKEKIIELMSKYEQVREQMVGIDGLGVEGELLPPTIENWLYDYKMKLGTGNHNSLQRSGYAYNSVNAKKLERKEREKLSIILDSYDNKKKIWYNKLYEEVDFEAILYPERVFGESEGKKNNSEKKVFNIKKMENKPFYETDLQKKKGGKGDESEKEDDPIHARRENPQKRTEDESVENSSKQDFQKTNTVDLNDYI
ncbi:MAG: hypothetical protein ACOCUF_01520 [Patescibacteria group bacterium]